METPWWFLNTWSNSLAFNYKKNVNSLMAIIVEYGFECRQNDIVCVLIMLQLIN